MIVAKLVASQTGCLLRDGPPVLSAAKALNSSPRFTPVVDLRIFTFILTSREDMSRFGSGFPVWGVGFLFGCFGFWCSVLVRLGFYGSYLLICLLEFI